MKAEKEDNRKWKLLESVGGPDIGVFQVRYDFYLNPRNCEKIEAVVLEGGDWVNVVATTKEEKIITVRQFRFGTSRFTTEIPGGLMDSHETPLEAAKRELREETGYTSLKWVYLGNVEPNPAVQSNLCHHWLAEDAEKTENMEQDLGEDIYVIPMGIHEIRQEILSGSLRHSLALSALSRVYQLWELPEKKVL